MKIVLCVMSLYIIAVSPKSSPRTQAATCLYLPCYACRYVSLFHIFALLFVNGPQNTNTSVLVGRTAIVHFILKVYIRTLHMLVANPNNHYICCIHGITEHTIFILLAEKEGERVTLSFFQ